MDEFVHRPKPFESTQPKIDQVMPPKPEVPAPTTEPETVASNDIPEQEPKDMDLPIPEDDKEVATNVNTTDVLTDTAIDTKPPQPKKKRISKKKLFLIIGIVLVLLIGAGATYWFYFKDKSQTSSNNDTAEVETTPEPVAKIISPLTGTELSSAELASRPVTGLMIENSWAARPQSGLTEAGIVFEAIAEGGITRFLALYQESQPQSLGPVRSIRPYYIDFAMAFDASVGHAGGSPDALNDISKLGMKNLEAFQNGGSFFRVNNRESPHNLYTSFANLDALNTSKGYTSSTFTPIERKPDVPQTPTAVNIDFTISGYDYSPHFEYDATTNTYKRFQAGQAHTDLNSGAQITPKVVVALVMNRNLMSDGSHNSYQTTGSGTMYVFQDGIVSIGTWSKADRTSSFIFNDKNGLPMALNVGQTWVSIVESDSTISYRL